MTTATVVKPIWIPSSSSQPPSIPRRPKVISSATPATAGGRTRIKFKYLFGKKICEVLIKLVRKEEQPREFQFGFNDKVVKRSLNLRNYDIYFNYGNRKWKIADPLDLSVKDFIGAVEKRSEPFVGYSDILSNTSLLKTIYDGYH